MGELGIGWIVREFWQAKRAETRFARGEEEERGAMINKPFYPKSEINAL